MKNEIKWEGKEKDTGRTLYKGINCQQNPNVFKVFTQFFNKVHFDYVIEIGTSYGGFSLFLHEQSSKHNFKFITYDWFDFKGGNWSNRTEPLKNKIGRIPFDMRNKNVFEDLTIKEISKILSNNKCLLLCDGGDKIKEFNIYSDYLSVGSYIMAHDYAPNIKYYKNKIESKRWKWFEIQDSDIKNAMEKNNIVKTIPQEDFNKVVWVQCKKKRLYNGK